MKRGEFAIGAGYFAYFGAVGVFQPWWPPYLQHLGFTAGAIGVLMAIFSAVRVVGPVGTAWLADHLHDRRPLLVIAPLLAAATVFALSRAESWWAAALGLAAFSLCFNGVMPVYDAHTLDRLGEAKQRYGRLRLWGSVGFVVVVYTAGQVVERAGVGTVPWLLFALVLLTAAFALLLPPVARHGHAPAATGRFVAALRQPAVIAFLLVCFLQQASFGAYYGFYSLYLQHYGFEPVTVSLYWAWGVVAEIAVFVFGPQLLRRFPLSRLLRAALAGTALRWALVAAFPAQPAVMLAAQALHLFGFGLFHAVTVLLAPRLLPPGSEARAQALVSSFGWGAGGIAGSLLAGWLWEVTGPRSVYVASLIIVMFALVVAVVALREAGDVPPSQKANSHP